MGPRPCSCVITGSLHTLALFSHQMPPSFLLYRPMWISSFAHDLWWMALALWDQSAIGQDLSWSDTTHQNEPLSVKQAPYRF